MDERDKKYYRRITHHKYERKIPYEKEDGSTWIRKCIYNEGYYPLDYLDKKKGNSDYTDDKYFIEDGTKSMKFEFRIYLVVVVAFFAFLAIGKLDLTDSVWQIVTSIFFILILPLSYYSVFHPPYIYIYNRLDGTVSIPRKYGMGYCTIPFNKVKYGTSSSRMGSISLTMMLPKWEFPLRTIGGEPETAISNYVWFMDKNRPLPPGKVFDPYRERDYQCRKAEGFPAPLYESYIKIEEYTSEQMAEAYNGKRVNIETFEREANSIWYDPNIHTDWEEVNYTKGDYDISPLKNEVICYKFADGRIVYCRSTATGNIYQPPTNEKFEKSLMVGGAIKEKIDRPITDKWEERQRDRF